MHRKRCFRMLFKYLNLDCRFYFSEFGAQTIKPFGGTLGINYPSQFFLRQLVVELAFRIEAFLKFSETSDYSPLDYLRLTRFHLIAHLSIPSRVKKAAVEIKDAIATTTKIGTFEKATVKFTTRYPSPP